MVCNLIFFVKKESSNMDRKEIYAEVKAVIVDRLGIDADKVNEGTSFVDDLGADSLDIVELVMEMEDQFGFEISDEDAENLKTVGDVVDYVKMNEDKLKLND